jgi:hypothetical protein
MTGELQVREDTPAVYLGGARACTCLFPEAAHRRRHATETSGRAYCNRVSSFGMAIGVA